jgi:hypothetical protein
MATTSLKYPTTASVPGVEIPSQKQTPDISGKTFESNLCDDPRWQLAQRIVASRSFAKSSFLISFLLYVCDRELRGRAHEITEHQIGIQAFGRPVTYNPGEDNIVRNYARLLRKRLDEYFESDGKEETLRIAIPRGRYVPVFSPSDSPEAKPVMALLSTNPADAGQAQTETLTYDESSGDIIAPQASSTLERSARSLSYLLISTATLVALLAIIYFGMRSFLPKPAPLSHKLWAQIFDRDRETLIVPADSSFGILQNLTHHPVHLSEYVNGSYLDSSLSRPTNIDARNLKDLTTQRYTSVVDLNITSSISRLPEMVPDRFAIRYARDLRMEDLKHSNALLLGSLHTNPWVELFQDNMNFVLEYLPDVDDSVVLNRHPLAGESAVYKNEWAEGSHRTYAVIALLPSLDGTGHVILLEGLNMAGTQAAGDFLLNEQTIDPILGKATRPDGTLQPFELLLETNSIGANAPEARVISERYGLQPASAK